jgi:hypothetical protein
MNKNVKVQVGILSITILVMLLRILGQSTPPIPDLSRAGITSVELYDRHSETAFVLTNPSQIDALVRIFDSWHKGWERERYTPVSYPVWMTLKAGSAEVLEIELGEDRVYALQKEGGHWRRKWRRVERRDTAEILRIFRSFGQRQESTPDTSPKPVL